MNFTSASIAREFILAGDALFTLRSLRTDAHYTFKVQKATNAERWFVKVLVAPDQYQYMGTIDGSPPRFRLTGKSQYEPESTSVRAFKYAFGWLSRDVIPRELEVKHSGKCGRCGRLLTNPTSIDRGFGPECQEILDKAHYSY